MRTIIRIAKFQVSKKQLLGGKIMLEKFFSKFFGIKSKENDVMKEQRIEKCHKSKKTRMALITFQALQRKSITLVRSMLISSMLKMDVTSCYTLQMMECQLVLSSGMESLMEKQRC